MQLESSVTLFDDNKVEDRFAELQVTADGITAEVGRKVGNDEVISRINQSAESIQIQANKVNIEGATIFSSGRLSQNSLDSAYDASGSATNAVSNLKSDLSSASGTTVINGGHIATNTLSASAVKADSGTFNTANIPDLNASKITTGTLSADRIGATSIAIGKLDTNAQNTIDNAGKTASSFITPSGNTGITVHAVNNPTSNYVQIDGDGMDIYNDGNSVASFGADGARLGANESYHTSVTSDSIEMVDANSGQLWAVSASGTTTTRTQTFLSAIATTRAVSKYTTINITDWASVQLTFTGKRTGSANVTETRTVSASTTSLSTVSMFGAISVTFSFSTNDNKKYMSMHATVMAYGSSGRNALDVTRTITSELPKLNFYGNNNVLWEKPSGSTVYPLLNEIITLSEPISAQPSGIVLLWGYDGSKSKVVTQYVPKHCAISSGFSEIPSGLICYQNMVYPALKTMYIVSDTQLRGADGNQTDGVTYHNNLNYFNSKWQLIAVCGI